MLEGIAQRIALADLALVKALDHIRAVRTRDLRGVVGAVVRNDNRRQHFLRIGLSVDGIQQLTDDPGLIARRDQYGEAVVLYRCIRFLFPEAVKEITGQTHKGVQHMNTRQYCNYCQYNAVEL